LRTTPIHADKAGKTSRVAPVTTAVRPGVRDIGEGKTVFGGPKKLKCGTGDRKWPCAVLF